MQGIKRYVLLIRSLNQKKTTAPNSARVLAVQIQMRFNFEEAE